jgi:uncharacterized membrane protein YphA (DoxX/SURF4 family)
MHSKELALVLLRVSLAFVFIYFAINQLSDPGAWNDFVPESLKFFGISGNNIVIFNGFVELVFGIFLLIGLYVRFFALIMAVHLFVIAFSIGFNPLGVRDFGLAFAILTLYFFGADKYTLDYKYSKRV